MYIFEDLFISLEFIADQILIIHINDVAYIQKNQQKIKLSSLKKINNNKKN